MRARNRNGMHSARAERGGNIQESERPLDSLPSVPFMRFHNDRPGAALEKMLRALFAKAAMDLPLATIALAVARSERQTLRGLKSLLARGDIVRVTGSAGRRSNVYRRSTPDRSPGAAGAQQKSAQP